MRGKTPANMDEINPLELQQCLEHLEECSNIEQLTYLYHELPYIMDPCQEWYETRFRIVEAYSHLNLSALAQRYETRDPYLRETAQLVFAFAAEIIDQWGVELRFDLHVYHTLIDNLYNLFTYYHKHYDQEEEAVEDLADMIMEM